MVLILFLSRSVSLVRVLLILVKIRYIGNSGLDETDRFYYRRARLTNAHAITLLYKFIQNLSNDLLLQQWSQLRRERNYIVELSPTGYMN